MDNITLENLDFKKLLPEFMKKDITDMVLAEMVNNMMKMAVPDIEKLRIWDKIDELSEKQLDDLADYLNIGWYLYDASVDKKRLIIKSARKVHRHLGTVGAMEYVLSIYFEEAKVINWSKYGGKVRHYKIETYNQDIKTLKEEDFLRIIKKVGRVAAVLDEIVVYSTSSMNLNNVMRQQTASFETNEIVY